MKKMSIKRGSYYDSVFLMLASRELKGLDGIADAIVAMATPMNVELLAGLGYSAGELEGLGSNDLVVAVDASNEEKADAAISAAFSALAEKKTSSSKSGQAKAPSLAAAIKLEPDANLAIVSVPGIYAAREARKALDAGLHTMVFSDNVSIEDEIELKRYALSKGLLLMGPDCGTAFINGKPLCFANDVRRGPIGIVAASGTGLQEICCLVDRYGQGISQAIGTGGRDLKNPAIGGMTSLLALEALAKDPETKVIVVIAKPPAEETAAKVVDALRASGKLGVVHFLGAKAGQDEKRLAFAANLEETALLAVLFASGSPDSAAARKLAGNADTNSRYGRPEKTDLARLAAMEAAKLGEEQRWLRGLFTGGTLADEALFLAHEVLGGVSSNNQTDPAWIVKDPLKSEGHCILDLGDDFFTSGKPHPMIDPAARAERIEAEGDDPECAVLLIDCVIGYGSHDDPAGACVPVIRRAKAKAAKRGGSLPVIASVTGTDSDPQKRSAQINALEGAGAIVMPSNYHAALLAIEIARLARQGGNR
ncbi:acyl-CoA synthetase FdrA [Spirochaetota bacterium]